MESAFLLVMLHVCNCSYRICFHHLAKLHRRQRKQNCTNTRVAHLALEPSNCNHSESFLPFPSTSDRPRCVCIADLASNSCPRRSSVEATCPHLDLLLPGIRQITLGHRISENCRYIQHVLQQCLVASPCPAAAFAMFPFTNASRRGHRSNTCCVVCPGRSLIPVRCARRMLLVLSRAPGFFDAAHRIVVRTSLLCIHGDIGFAAWTDGLRFNRDPDHLI